ncbi:MAG: hypothetical protein ACREX6_12495 [Casimicrobiaceae bacterium]
MHAPGPSLWLAKPELSDAAAAEVLDFLYDLLTAFENTYFDQLHRHYASCESSTQPAPPTSHIDPDKDPF